MTAVEWLFQELWETPKDKLDWYAIRSKALEMERQQTKDIIEMARDSSICECALGTHIEYEHTEGTIFEQLKQSK